MVAVFGGKKGLLTIIQQGPSSIVAQSLLAVFLIWAALGCALLALKKVECQLIPSAVILVVLSLFVVYVNFGRESIYPGDIVDYIKAAYQLRAGEAFHARYIYPPFLATLLQPLLWLGEKGLYLVFWVSNQLALPVCFALVYKLLHKNFNYSRINAAVALFLLFFINVPLLRNQIYGQINVHVLNCILLGVLCGGRWTVLSALFIAIAVSLKASPLVLVPVFALRYRVKWSVCFLLCMLLIAGLTWVSFGYEPYLWFWKNGASIYEANGVCFREFSVDSMVRSTALVAGLSAPLYLAPLIKGAAVMAFGFLYLRSAGMCLKEGWGFSESQFNEMISMALLAMVLLSPVIWVHHLVFVVVPIALLISRLSSVREALLLAALYLPLFWMPVFDLYPLSLMRLFALLGVAYLLLRKCGSPGKPWVSLKWVGCSDVAE
ncbi:MAG: glycosyltransferase family 87 protein [Kiritimatiellae bacterium]|nr:glycosyltransferase family 87 protein [Kiritimatiellia bacterium]